jgi:hypothetical protein
VVEPERYLLTSSPLTLRTRFDLAPETYFPLFRTNRITIGRLLRAGHGAETDQPVISFGETV